MGLFSGMEKFGLGNFAETKIYEDPSLALKEKEQQVDTRTPEEKEAECLYVRNYECPVCGLTFSTLALRAGKARMVDKDTDLRPIYEVVDPIKYDVLACDKCGYSALIRYFGKVEKRQKNAIREQLGQNFKGFEYNVPIYSYDIAIERYKLALLTAIVKNAKNSERGYICLKLAWTIRGKRLTLDQKEMAPIKEVYMEELEAMNNSLECFKLAISKEDYPIAGMDENTLYYVMGDMARRLRRYDEASKYVASVLVSKNANSRLKDQALTLKDMIKEDMKKHAN